jgi:hypothetical protein
VTSETVVLFVLAGLGVLSVAAGALGVRVSRRRRIRRGEPGDLVVLVAALLSPEAGKQWRASREAYQRDGWRNR